MEHKQIGSSPLCDGLPPLSSNYPWLVAQNLGAEDDSSEYQIFYTVHDPLLQYRCRIPELVGRHIEAIFHGWVILTNHPHGIEWFLWNPVTSKLIRLPPLILKDGDTYDDILNCCLSAPPDDPGSILLLTRTTKPNFVFCRLNNIKRKKLKWTEMSYSKQLISINDGEDDILIQPTCCNGKVYAYTSSTSSVIQVNIVANDKEVVISLSPFVSLPDLHGVGSGGYWCIYLKESYSQLFAIIVSFTDLTKLKPIDVYLYKLDMTSMAWVEMDELKDTVFFVDTISDDSITCSPAIASELRGYIHIIHENGRVIYSCDVKDKTISLSSIHCLDHLPPRSRDTQTNHISVWTIPGLRPQGDHGEAKCKADFKQVDDMEIEMVTRSIMNNDQAEWNEPLEQNDEASLLNIPFHVLEKIMKLCVGVDYLHFRATSKSCHLAAPVIQWGNIKARKRLQTYSLVSPWLVVFEKHQGVISFTDPKSGDKYFRKASPKLFDDTRILCSRYGWLLMYINDVRVAFFNPFTGDIRKLPPVGHVERFCFSAPPTSPDCMVVGLSALSDWHVYIYLAGQPSWRRVVLDFGGATPSSFGFPTLCGRAVYALFNEGGLGVIREIHNGNDLSWETIIHEGPQSFRGEYFLVKCHQHLLKVILGEFGESVEVLTLNDSNQEWEKMDDLGRHMIYICDSKCLCMDAKIPEMENKIYFPRLHCENGKMVFYSLETCRYHTFNGRNMEEDLINFFGTKGYEYAHAWIEPSWS